MNLNNYMFLFLKGIVAGFGGIAPGLSGSVLLIILGLYQQILEYLGSIFKEFKKKFKFLFPIVLGMILGVLMFSKLINYLLAQFEMPTRYAFLGLILGTVPMFYKELKKEGFSKKYYFVIIGAFMLGIWIFTSNANSFPQISEPTIFHSITLGIAVAATAIIPGVDPAVLLSSIGYYELYVDSLATVNLTVLLPMLIGLVVGAIIISNCMTYLFKKFYTAVFSIIFGIFLAMIPNMLNKSCVLKLDGMSIISIIIVIICFIISLYLSTIQKTKGCERK